MRFLAVIIGPPHSLCYNKHAGPPVGCQAGSVDGGKDRRWFVVTRGRIEYWNTGPARAPATFVTGWSFGMRLRVSGASAVFALLLGLVACTGSASPPPSATTAPVVATAPAASSPTPTVLATATPLVVAATPTSQSPSSQSPTATVEAATPSPVATATTAVTATSNPPPDTPAAAPPTPTSAVKLTADQIAATAVAESVGEQCVPAPPKPTKGFIGDPSRGKVLFEQRGCSACHGGLAEGGVGPKLAGTTLPFDAVLHQLRQPRGVMQRYLPSDQSDADECDVYIYVKSLKP